MSFGGIGIVRKLLLCGTAVAVVQAMPGAMARSHHHTTHHRTTHHATASHGKTGHAGEPNRKAAAPSTKAAGGGTGEKLELVPGPIPLPRPASRRGASAAAPQPNAPAHAVAQTRSVASQAVKPTAAPAAASLAAATPAKGAIATAVAKLFVGEPVYGPKGERIGRLSEIVTSPDGQVKSAVISWGGVLGYFQSSRTIAWPEAGPSVQGGRLVLRKMTKDELHNGAAPRPEASR